MKGTLYESLTKAARHYRCSQALRLLLLTGCIAPVLIAGLCITDNLFNLSEVTRRVIFGGMIGTTCIGLIRLFWILWFRPIRSARVAVFLEQQYGIDDNRLINALQLSQDPNLPNSIKQLLVTTAEETCATFDFWRIWKQANLLFTISLATAGVLLFLAYAIPFHAHAWNALTRYLQPQTSRSPLNYTQFKIAPGDFTVIEGSSCPIYATGHRLSRPVTGLEILIQSDQSAFRYAMSRDTDGYTFTLNNLKQNTRYAICNGNDQSRWYTVRVLRKPNLTGLTLTATPPAYTGEKTLKLDPLKHTVEILAGSVIQIHSGLAKELTSHFKRNDRLSDSNELTFALTTNTLVTLNVTDKQGLTYTNLWQCTLISIKDKVPEVRFTNRELNIQATLGQTVPLHFDLADDYGVGVMEIYISTATGDHVFKTFTYTHKKRTRQETYVLPITSPPFHLKGHYKIRARVYDAYQPPQCGEASLPFSLHITDSRIPLVLDNPEDHLVQLYTGLSEALDLQKQLRDWVATRISHDRKERVTSVVQTKQENIHHHLKQSTSLSIDLHRQGRLSQRFMSELIDLVEQVASPLLKQTSEIATRPETQQQTALNALVLNQGELITRLQKLLGILAHDKDQTDLAEERLTEEEQNHLQLDQLESLKKGLEAFQEDQRKVIATLEAIDKKAPEDWTDAEEKLLGDLAAKQQEFAKFFQAALNDLSKLENQDFSNSAMADELIEMIEELQKAGAALEQKHIEIATVNEELLGQQAESISANLERWLADAKDFIKWTGEEGGVFPDVPLQDLPDELTDIIGELIDDVADMSDVEDSSGSSLSAMDDGLGWGVSDGNMDNMSARGITGNIMPNNNEVGGRSGEGRSGKSSGQFVEKEATGKGGRDTPTRLVQSPFEQGTVRDLSKDPQGGATGGGKQSGLGDGGLRGIPPDQRPDIQQRLPGQQAELHQKAEALLRELHMRNLPTGDLEDAVQKMALIQKYASTGQGLELRQVRSDLLSTLKDAQTAVHSHVAGGMEQTHQNKPRITTIHYSGSEPTPKGYETVIESYFRVLAQPQTGEKSDAQVQ